MLPCVHLVLSIHISFCKIVIVFKCFFFLYVVFVCMVFRDVLMDDDLVVIVSYNGFR